MKSLLLWLGLGALLSACSLTPLPSPTPLPQTFAPIQLAQTTNAPTATGNPPTTTTAPPTAVATDALSPTAVLSTETPSTRLNPLAAPTILGQVKLLDLPGAGREPVALAVLGQDLYAANRASDNVAVIRDERAQSYIPTSGSPSALAADPARNRVYVGTYLTPTLYLLENERLARQRAAGGRINALALDGDNLYVALDNDALIERYDSNTLDKVDERKLSQGFGVSALVADAPRNRLYAAVYGKIIALDLSTFEELFTLAAPGLYSKFAVNPSDGSIWTGAYDDQSARAYVVGYSPEGTEIAKLFVGGDLRAATIDEADRLYVLDRFNNQVHVIQTPEGQLVATLDVNQAPSDAVLDRAGNRIVVANQENDNLSVIDPAALRVVNTIPLAGALTAIASNPARNRVYVASSSTNSVFVLDEERVVGEVKTRNEPVDLAVDPMTNRVYVASRADGWLTVFDENTLKIQTSQFITRNLSTVAVDPVNRRLFAGGNELDPVTLVPQQTFSAQGLTIGSQTVPLFERVNPTLEKIYAIASNGVPGSNSRVTLFRFLYDDLSQSKLLGSKNGGNTSALTVDLSTNRVYAANTHPLAYTHGLDVFDREDNLIQSLALNSHTTHLAVNPSTHHLFLSHARTFKPNPQAVSRDNIVEILDTRSLGRVATLQVNDPWRMTVMNDQVYIASFDGMVTLLGDALTAQPPAPTPTFTPSPYPTWTDTPTPTNTTAVVTPGAVVQCDTEPAAPFLEIWQANAAALGCPINPPLAASFAVQTFRDGYMFDDLSNPDAQKIYALMPDGTFAIFDDTWREGEPERSCPDVPIPTGRIRPKRGFGKVWCENSRVREQLSGAVAEEAGVTLVVQTFDHGALWTNTPRGVIALFDDGTWK